MGKWQAMSEWAATGKRVANEQWESNQRMKGKQHAREIKKGKREVATVIEKLVFMSFLIFLFLLNSLDYLKAKAKQKDIKKLLIYSFASLLLRARTIEGQKALPKAPLERSLLGQLPAYFCERAQ